MLLLLIVLLTLTDTFICAPRFSIVPYANGATRIALPIDAVQSYIVITGILVLFFNPSRRPDCESAWILQRTDPVFNSQFDIDNSLSTSDRSKIIASRPSIVVPEERELRSITRTEGQIRLKGFIAGLSSNANLEFEHESRRVRWRMPPDKMSVFVRADCTERVKKLRMDIAKSPQEGFDLSTALDTHIPQFSTHDWKRLWTIYSAISTAPFGERIAGRQHSFGKESKFSFLNEQEENQFGFLWVKEKNVGRLRPFAAMWYSPEELNYHTAIRIAVEESAIEPLDILNETGIRLTPLRFFQTEAVHWRNSRYDSPDFVVVGGQYDWMDKVNPSSWVVKRDICRHPTSNHVQMRIVQLFLTGVVAIAFSCKLIKAIKSCKY